MTLRSNIGLSPWDVLADGIRLKTPLTFGTAVIAIGVVLVVASAIGRVRPGIGTIANMVLIGVFADLMLASGVGAGLMDGPLVWRVALDLGGIVTIGLGSALYIGAGLGTGPRDSLMVLLSRRAGLRIGVARAIVEGTALLGGIALGGTAGVGTALFAIGIGPAVDTAFRLFGMEVRPKVPVDPR
ncbi:MAG: hypothetical protein KY391_05035 [Actinobacteria bacterium]|nr:hypothetical protein [Actinomycetota bacterium]